MSRVRLWDSKEGTFGNKIIFLKILKYWPSSHDFNKLVIKVKMHANTYFWNFLCYMKIQYDFFLKTWPYAWKQNILFYFYFFNFLIILFLRKPSILILDLYIYNIKIQTNISKCNKIFAENHVFLKRIFFSGWVQPGLCSGLDLAT